MSDFNCRDLIHYQKRRKYEKEHQYSKHVESVNKRGRGNYACETILREFENYIHPTIIKECYNYDIPIEHWNVLDIPEEVAKRNLAESESEKSWDELDMDDKKKRAGKIKNQIAEIHCKKISKKTLDGLGSYNEVKSWYEKIAELSA